MTDARCAPVTFHVFGAFCVTGPDGSALTPASAKGQALLALLLTAPHLTRTRVWLQDKLWSASDPVRGGANLRQVLATLRRALGPSSDVLGADRRRVWLDGDRVVSDWTTRARADGAGFLEGLDIDDPEFSAWLAGIRAGGAAPVSPALVRRPRAPGPDREPVTDAWPDDRPDDRPNDRPDDRADASADASADAGPGADADHARRWRIALDGGTPPGSLAAHLEADALALLSRSLMETGAVDIAAGGNTPRDPLAIDVALTVSPLGAARHAVRVTVIRPERRRILWSAAQALDIAPGPEATDPGLVALVASAQAAILREMSQAAAAPPGLDAEAAVLARSAHRMFSFDAETLARTDRCLAEVQDGRAPGVARAMRAQIAVIRDIERLTDAPEETAERGLYLAARALEVDPFNSQVLAAAANAHVFLHWDVETGAALAEAALETNGANPLAWWARANVALYTQAFDRALDDATTATRLARGTALQFWCQFQLGLAALGTGDLDLARRSLETSAAIAPSFRPPRRYLLALYTHLGQVDRAGRMARDLARLERSFSLDSFARDDTYPVSLARRVGLIDPHALADLDGP